MKTIHLTIRGVPKFTPARCEDNNIRSIVSKKSNKGQVLRPVMKKL